MTRTNRIPRTALLRDFDPSDREEFVHDLKILLALEGQDLDIVLETMDELASAASESELERVRARVYERVRRPAYRIDAALDVAQFLMGQLAMLVTEQTGADPGAEAAAWPDELLADESIDEADAASLRRLVPRLLARVGHYARREKRRRYAAGVFPSVTSIGTTVELRAVLQRDFELGEAPTSYAPVIEGLVPIVSVSLTLGEDEVVRFQMEPRMLGHVIDALRAAQTAAEQLRQLGRSVADCDED